MRVLLLAVLLSATGPIGESGGESIRCSLPAQTGCGGRQARERRHSISVLVDCSGKVLFPRLGIRGGKRVGADVLRRGWIGLTMKPLIGYGSDVSASGPARLVGDKTCTWT